MNTIKTARGYDLHVTGKKYKAVKEYLESYISFIKKHRYCSILHMLIDHKEHYQKETENELGKERYANLYGSSINRIRMTYIYQHQDLVWEELWNSQDKYSRIPLDEYIKLCEDALVLPAEWSTDLL